MGCIYKITNLVNNKLYIGLSTYTAEIRFKGHLDSIFKYESQLLIHKAIRKYGKENFKVETICKCNKIESLKVLEKYYIKKYHTFIGDPLCNGYNMTIGGRGLFGYHHTEETKQKIREKRKLQVITEETKRKIGQKSKGNKYMLGRHHSEEAKKKISESHKGHPGWNKGISCSEEVKKKLSKYFKGRKLDEQWKNRISRANKGKKRTEEQKQKISEKTKEYMNIPEVKEKLRQRMKGNKYNIGNENMLGKHHSEETKQNMSERMKGEKNHMFGKIPWNKGKKYKTKKKHERKTSI
jgi:group I intron endonuclease